MNIELTELKTESALKLPLILEKMDRNEPLVLDAIMKWVRPFGMLYGGMVIRQFCEQNRCTSVSMNIHQDKDAITYAGHMGFFKFISPALQVGKMPGEASGNQNYLPITELDFNILQRERADRGNYIEMGNLIEEEAGKLSLILSRSNKEIQVLLTYLLREILRNIPEHSNSTKAWICGQYWSDNTAEIAIIDEGIGIKKSLQRNVIHRKYILDDEDALKCSVKAGISKAFQPAKK